MLSVSPQVVEFLFCLEFSSTKKELLALLAAPMKPGL